MDILSKILSIVTPQPPGYIYILWDYAAMPDIDSTRIKIGFSIDPVKRMRAIETQSGLEFAMMMCYYPIKDKSISSESIVFNVLSEYRHIGEWFRISPFKAMNMINASIAMDNLNPALMHGQLWDMLKSRSYESLFACGIKLEDL